MSRTTPPKVTELWSPTSEELLSHLGHCWAKPAGAAPKGVIAPILRNGKCYLWSQEKLFWAAAELKCRSINSHLTSVTTKKIHDYLKQDVSENYVFMKSLSIAGEDPKWYLDRRNRPIPRGQLDLDRLQPLELRQMGLEGRSTATGQLETC